MQAKASAACLPAAAPQEFLVNKDISSMAKLSALAEVGDEEEGECAGPACLPKARTSG